MSVSLYHTWLEQIEQIAGKARVTVLRNFTWLMLGMVASRSVHLHRIADEFESAECDSTKGWINLGFLAKKPGCHYWKDRRDLSVFRIGHSILKRHLKFDQFLPFRLSPYFS